MSLRFGAGRALSAVVALALVCLGAGTLATSARAEGCPNEQLRGQDGHALALPDCRAYEQVSPVDKNFTDALGFPGAVQSSAVRRSGHLLFHSAVPGGDERREHPHVPQYSRRWRMVNPGARAAANPPTAGGSEEELDRGPDRRPLRGAGPRRTRPRSGHGARRLLLSPRQRHRRLPAARPRRRQRSRTPQPAIRASSSSPANSSCRTLPPASSTCTSGMGTAARSRTELGWDPARRRSPGRRVVCRPGRARARRRS